jgi:hypothetical protein
MEKNEAISQFNKIKSCIGNIENEQNLDYIRFVLEEIFGFFKNYFTSLGVWEQIKQKIDFEQFEKIINTSSNKEELMKVYRVFYSLADRQIRIITEANL